MRAVVGVFRGSPPLNMLKVSRLVRGLVRPLGAMRGPQRLAEFKRKAHSSDCCLSGPTIFLGHPTKCNCDYALPARGEGKGGGLPLHNERLSVPHHIFVPSGAAVRRQQWRHQHAKQRSSINITNPNGPTTRHGNLLFLPDSTGSNWCPLPNESGALLYAVGGLVTRPPKIVIPWKALSTN